ncbi:MAG: magnesium transporter CorA family protein [Candidatus Doudnabacteria bacterium]|nr:magnesium transporter CorA family protein [Candidatus Doudnabacteria bacterium]
MSLKIIHTKNLKWIDIVNPGEEDIGYLKNHFRFHPLDFDDVKTPSTRTKIDEYDQYHFLILLFPRLEKNTNELKPAEVDFFVGDGFVITIHDGKIKTLANLVHNVSQYDNLRLQYTSDNSGFLLFSILELLFKRSFPILDTINREMEAAGKEIFESNGKILQELSRLKKNIIVYRRVMKMHKYVLTKLMRSKNEYLDFKLARNSFQNLIEYVENIWDVLASDKETAESYEETNQSLAAHRMNDVLKTLTIFSVIIFLLTLIVNILVFADYSFKFASVPFAFPASLILLGIVTLIMLAFFKNRRWL